MTEKWPLDFDALRKGDIIEESTCRRIVDKPTQDAYRLGLLALKERIERELLARGIAATVKCQGDAIAILTDAEASIYNEVRQKMAIKSFVTTHRRLIQVDTAQLSSEQKIEHDRRIDHSQKYLSAITEASKSIKAIPTPEPERPKLG